MVKLMKKRTRLASSNRKIADAMLLRTTRGRGRTSTAVTMSSTHSRKNTLSHTTDMAAAEGSKGKGSQREGKRSAVRQDCLNDVGRGGGQVTAFRDVRGEAKSRPTPIHTLGPLACVQISGIAVTGQTVQTMRSTPTMSSIEFAI